MASKSVIRLWWGECHKDYDRYKNRLMLETTMKCVLNDKYQVPFVTYVLGRDNYDYLKSQGLEDLVLVNPDIYSLRPEHKRNAIQRLDLCEIALQDFDEIICVNWDCRLVKPWTDETWSLLGEKETIQTALTESKRRAARDRPMLSTRGNQNHIYSLDGFLYLRDKTMPSKVLAMLDEPYVINKWTPESLISHYLDKIHGGWIGIEEYWKLYEPECFYAGRCAAFKAIKRNKIGRRSIGDDVMWDKIGKRPLNNIQFSFQTYFKFRQNIAR